MPTVSCAGSSPSPKSRPCSSRYQAPEARAGRRGSTPPRPGAPRARAAIVATRARVPTCPPGPRRGRDGFIVRGNGNALGDGTAANRNLAERNLVDGFDVEAGTGNTLDRNLTRNNEGEGIENNAAGTELRNNRSAGNRIDCAADVPPTVNSGNECADGSDFAVPPQGGRLGRS